MNDNAQTTYRVRDYASLSEAIIMTWLDLSYTVLSWNWSSISKQPVSISELLGDRVSYSQKRLSSIVDTGQRALCLAVCLFNINVRPSVVFTVHCCTRVHVYRQHIRMLILYYMYVRRGSISLVNNLLSSTRYRPNGP